MRRIAACLIIASAAVLHGEPPAPSPRQDVRLVARSTLAPGAIRNGSPPSGAFLTGEERATAATNGVKGSPTGSYFPGQPVQGFSSMVPANERSWWALSDNGFAWRTNSADYQLIMYRVDPRWGDARGAQVVETVVMRDPDRRIPWSILCDRESGTALPPFSFNAMPARPFACGEKAARVLTGFDFDPESFVRAADGTFWVSEEFGPFLLHVGADGRLLEAPIEFPGIRSPQNPHLRIDREPVEKPTIASSRGFEGLAISPDGTKLYALLEGAVTGDDGQDLRLFVYDTSKRTLSEKYFRVRLEMPSLQVDLTSLGKRDGRPVYPGASKPPAGPASIGELKAVNDHQLLLIERDNLGDGLAAPRHKKIYLLDLSSTDGEGRVSKRLLIDLLAIPDPLGVGGDGDFFRMPFYTIESVHVVDRRTLLVACDNNFPFSSGRSRSRTVERRGPLAADETEIILVELGTELDVDERLLPRGGPSPAH